MPSHPTLFDDDDPRRSSTSNAPPNAPSNAPPAGTDRAQVTDTVTNDASPERSGRDSRRPNYLARRALVVGGAVAAIALGAIGIGRLIESGDDGDGSGVVDAEWNRVVLVDGRRGELTVVGEDGSEVASYETGIRNATAHRVAGRTAVVADDTSTAVVVLTNGELTEFATGSAAVTVPAGTTLTMLAPNADSSQGLVVHGPSGDVIDTADYAPVTGATYDFARAISAPSGRHVLVTDVGNFQTVLFSFDREEPAYFPGLALAIDDDTVVTAQNVGDQATINVFDHDGESLASGRTESVRAALLGDGSIVLVTVDGTVVTMDLDSGEAETGIPLGVGAITSGAVLPAGDRLVVVGAEGTRVIDPDGNAVGSFAGMTPLDDAGALHGAHCVVLTGIDGTGAVVIDARTGDPGEQIRLTSDAVSRSADGCTVAVDTGDAVDIVTMDGVTATIDGTLGALAPDARAVVVDIDRTLRLAPIDEEADAEPVEPVELGRTGSSVAFFDS